MASITIAGFPGGIDNLSPETSLTAGFCRDAVDVLVNRSGEASHRPGKRRLLSAAGLHSLWTSPGTNLSLCVSSGWLCRARIIDNALTLAPLVDVGDGHMDYADGDDAVYCSNGAGIWKARHAGGTVEVADAVLPVPAFDAEANGSGGLPAGAYAVAVSFMAADYEEGALSEAQFVEATEGGGVAITVAWPADGEAGSARVAAAILYSSAPNGEQLRAVKVLARQIGVETTTYAFGAADPRGRLALTRHLQPMPSGHIIRIWQGWLLAASGSVLRWSQPMHFGVHDPRTGFVQFGTDIAMVEPVMGGVFVGTAQEVAFLAGPSPRDWTRRLTAAATPIAGCSMAIPARELGGDHAQAAQRFALWLSSKGWVLGLPDGGIHEVQCARLQLPQYGSGAVGWHQRRAWAVVS